MKDYRKSERKLWLLLTLLYGACTTFAILSAPSMNDAQFSTALGIFFGCMFGMSLISYISSEYIPMHRHRTTSWYWKLLRVKAITTYKPVDKCKTCKSGDAVIWNS